METSEVLIQAADALERDGWQQHYIGEPGGPRCVMGALRGVLGETTIVTLVEQPAYRALREHIQDYVSDWNDAPGRSAAEVVTTLRVVAAKAVDASSMAVV